MQQTWTHLESSAFPHEISIKKELCRNQSFQNRLEYLFISLGKPFSKADLVKLRELLTDYLQQGFQSASSTYLNIKYRPTESPDTGINYTISHTLNPDIQPPPNNREIEMRVPAMLGMKSKIKLRD